MTTSLPASSPPSVSIQNVQTLGSYRERMGESPFAFFPDSSMPTHDEAFRENLMGTSAAVPLDRLKEHLPSDVIPTVGFAKLEVMWLSRALPSSGSERLAHRAVNFFPLVG